MSRSLIKFTRNIFLFSLPLIVFYAFIYAYASFYPSIFKKKVDYMDKHKAEIEVLFLGSSHAQYAINPRLIDAKAMNLAYGGQTIMLNKMLFEKFVSEMPKLKYLLLELDYFSLEHFTGNEEYRQPLYQKFYDIAPGNNGVLNKYVFSVDDVKFFSQSAAQTALNYVKNSNYSVNEWGFVENNVHYQFARLNYDKEKIEATANERIGGSHVRASRKNYGINVGLMNSILLYCKQHNIRPILIGYPVYDTYYKMQRETKKERRLYYANEVMKIFPDILFWNFEQDSRFTVHDFWDDDHLDTSGGNKLSTIINEKLLEIAK